MVSARVAIVGSIVALAQASYLPHANTTGVAYTTEVVTAYTTYCPAPTEIVHGDKTYTVTEATTLTITDCPCTLTKPVVVPTKPVYTTEVVTAYTTYCPEPTVFAHGNKTYTVTEPTTVTVACPGGCVVTKPNTDVPVATKPVVPGKPEEPTETKPVVPDTPEEPVAPTTPAAIATAAAGRNAIPVVMALGLAALL